MAGLSDLEGLPWTMPMEQFFEAWIETVLRMLRAARAECCEPGVNGDSFADFVGSTIRRLSTVTRAGFDSRARRKRDHR